MDPNGYRQWARPSLHVFILKELNAAECEGLACKTKVVKPPPPFSRTLHGEGGGALLTYTGMPGGRGGGGVILVHKDLVSPPTHKDVLLFLV